ncbi:MAG: leucine--tRNA ligase [Spirochaetaceae bacterium]|jgi:leucyl-tRNA synthetase|nr:leucine--tRNA ligase [Spirochaetaceae bacterium]
MAKYPFETIEPKWQKYWEDHKTFKAEEDPSFPKDKRAYVLDMFPYPSAQGLHVGHPEGYTATDIYCRYLRMKGCNVLHPMGFDSFGLPAENYAIKMGVHPAKTTADNIEHFRRQIKALGFSYDWDRELATSDENYYKWTQWIFLKLFEKGLAYEAESPINWCPSCKTGLANEEVVDGLCERCKTRVVRRRIRQWILKITAYAERLLDDLDGLAWPEPVKQMQRNWIGRSEGANVVFKIDGHTGPDGGPLELEIYTTRPDTLFGVTYMVLSPEHPLAETITSPAQKAAVSAYLEEAAKKSDLERTDLAKTKTGVFSGAYAVNPVNGGKIPVWIADYVLISYGTGAIMAVPAHDERDWEFAKTFNLPIIPVVSSSPPKGGKAPLAPDPRSAGSSASPLPGGSAPKPPSGGIEIGNGEAVSECTTAEGWSINSGPFSGLPTAEAKAKVSSWIEEQGFGRKAVNYKLRDWIFSRQRYWGEPIPIVHCDTCGIVPLPEKDLPLKLPDVRSYAPTGTGESPLAAISGWVNTVCPKCGARAKRETNTMPQWAGSCWYYLRYLDPHNKETFAAPDKQEYWGPVDLYVGGVEHAVLHLLYSRFWHKVLYDFGLVKSKEPFIRLVNQGMITSFAYQRGDKTLVSADQVEKISEGRFIEKESGEEVTEVIAKMSKSLKNIINPDDIVRDYGADALRVYEMFMGPLEVSKPWSTAGLTGVSRFLERLWAIAEKCRPDSPESVVEPAVEPAVSDNCVRLLHKTIKKVSNDTATLNFNTAISQMMIYSNELAKLGEVPCSLWEPLVIMASAYAPHLGEELWERLGHSESVSRRAWPVWDETLAADNEVTIVVQVNGKIRDKFTAPAGTPKADLEKTAGALPGVLKWTEGRTVVKVISVADKLVNLVIT